MTISRRAVQGLSTTAVLCMLGACVGVVDDTTAPERSARGDGSTAPVLPSGPWQGRAGGLPGASYGWLDRTEVFVPRMLPSVVDQPSRGRVLVYGGWQENGVRFDTWEWDGNGWLRRRPLHDPGTRVGAAVAYDELRHRVILTGGGTDFLPRFTFDTDSTTWEWDGRDWTKLSVVHAPAPTAGAASTWDPTQNRMLMFGGFSPPGTAGSPEGTAPGNDAMWSFDGFDWQQIPRTEPWPPASGIGSMTWDRARNRAVLLTGYQKLVFEGDSPGFGTDDNGQPIFEPTGQTWEWDGATWTLTGNKSDNGIVSGGGLVYYDPVQQKVGMEVTEVDLLGRTIRQGLRRYEGAAWPLVAYAPEGTLRILVNGTWSTANQAPFVFGGVRISAGTFQLQTEIALDEGLAANPWRMEPTPVQMPALHEMAAFTEADGSTVLFGGVSGTARTSAMFRWTGGRWTQVEPVGAVPSARSGASITRLGASAILFGGRTDTETLADTWTWTPASRTWTKQPDGPGPSARQLATMFELGGAAYLYGGLVGSPADGSSSSELWRYLPGGGWTLMPDQLINPGTRGAACAASLPDKSKAYLVGAAKDGPVFSYDDGWTVQAITSALGEREGCSMVYGTSFGQMLVVGGGGAAGTQDLWSLTPTIDGIVNATNVEARGERPPRRTGAMFVDNPRTGGVVLFGGQRNDTSGELADTWQLKVLGQACTDASTCGNGAFCTEGVCCEVETCGPCATCATGGLCAPRPAGPVAGCDGAYACNGAGHCRLGAGQICAEADACATGACIKADAGGTGVCCGTEGCAVTCVDDQRLRNAEGVLTDCAPYKCEGNQCKLGCASVTDCTGTAICDANGKCIEPGAAGDGEDSSCGCKVAGARSAGSPWGWGSLLGLTTIVAVRRQLARRRSLAR